MEYVNIQAEKLLLKINGKRKDMMNCAKKNGLTNEDTIKYSQELDELLNQYNRFRYSLSENEKINFARMQMMIVWPKEVVGN